MEFGDFYLCMYNETDAKQIWKSLLISFIHTVVPIALLTPLVNIAYQQGIAVIFAVLLQIILTVFAVYWAVSSLEDFARSFHPHGFMLKAFIDRDDFRKLSAVPILIGVVYGVAIAHFIWSTTLPPIVVLAWCFLLYIGGVFGVAILLAFLLSKISFGSFISALAEKETGK